MESREAISLLRDHTCATDMHRGGADIRYVQELLGHARLETTQIYTHVNIEALREIHTRCHPHGKLSAEKYRPSEEKSSPPEQNPLMPHPMSATIEQHTNKEPIAPEECSSIYKSPIASEDPPPEEDGGTSNVKVPTTPPKNGPLTTSVATPNPKKPRKINNFTPRVTCYAYRHYDPNLGRWILRDPIGEGGGLNLYGFVRNNAISIFDYLGESELQNNQINQDEIKRAGRVENVGGVILTRQAEITVKPPGTRIIGIDGNVNGKHESIHVLNTRIVKDRDSCPFEICCNRLYVVSGAYLSKIEYIKGDMKAERHEATHHFDGWAIFKQYALAAKKIADDAGCVSEKDAKCYDAVIKNELNQLHFVLSIIKSNDQHLKGPHHMLYPEKYKQELHDREVNNNNALQDAEAKLKLKLERCFKNEDCPFN